jgi:hypothetical protein
MGNDPRAVMWKRYGSCQVGPWDGRSKLLCYRFWPAIPWPTLTRAISLSHNCPWPPCRSLPFTTCSVTLPTLPRRPPSYWPRLFSSQPLSSIDTQTILKFSHSTPTCLWRWYRQSVPKRRHKKFRRRGITQKKTYKTCLNTLNSKLNPICHLPALLGTHPILHVNRIRVN